MSLKGDLVKLRHVLTPPEPSMNYIIEWPVAGEPQRLVEPGTIVLEWPDANKHKMYAPMPAFHESPEAA
jgi:hypothetical protein